jgi:hypothetical protein
MRTSTYFSILRTIILSFLSLFIFAVAYADEAAQAWEERYKDEPSLFLKYEKIVELRKDFTVKKTIRNIVKIQKEGGKKLGEIKFNYDSSREIINDIKAFTITPEGKRLEATTIQDLDPYKQYAIYSDNKVKVITMPNVVIGSTIEWERTSETTKPMIDGHFFERFYLTPVYPVKEQKLVLIAPDTVKLNFRYSNKERKPVIAREDGKVIYTWKLMGADKIDPEEYMPPWEELMDVVSISTMDSWKDLSKWAWGLFEKNIRISSAIEQAVDKLTDDKKSKADKVQAIIEHIRNDFRYVSMNMDFHSYEPHPSDEIYTNKYGDCKDQTILGIAMLSKIGVKAYPVLYPSSKGFDQEKALPMPDYFNHAIIYFELEGKKYYTDLLKKGYHFSQVPVESSGLEVFVVNEKEGFFGKIPEVGPDSNVIKTEEHVVIDGTGGSIIELKAIMPIETSTFMRTSLQELPAEYRKKALEAAEAGMAAGGTVIESEWLNLDEPYKKVSSRVKIKNPNWVQSVGDMMIFGMEKSERADLFTSLTRVHPIVIDTGYISERKVTYEIPKGYEIVNMPAAVKLDHDFASYERIYNAHGSVIEGKEIYKLKKSRTPADKYDNVRHFFDNIPQKTNDKIMIKKKI